MIVKERPENQLNRLNGLMEAAQAFLERDGRMERGREKEEKHSEREEEKEKKKTLIEKS